MIVAIPSKGRAGQVRTAAILPSAALYVPENEAAAYRKFHPLVIAVPMSVRGITATRNYILNTADPDDPDVVMVDDDVKVQGWIQLKHQNGKHQALTEAAWLAEWKKLFAVTRGVGFRIWGVGTDGALRSVYPWRPFIWHTYVTASCMGICNESGVRFDESFPVKEDYELCLRCIKEDGGVVGARYLYWANEHWTGEGGCKSYRTQEMEEAATERLMVMYPRLIRRVERGGSKYSIELDF
ncbi:MAG: hypothetical protein ACREI9_08470 [Nitrospiraceae bacterium]